MMFAAGSKLGRYKIRSKIGEGGMGEVYLGLVGLATIRPCWGSLGTPTQCGSKKMKR